MQNRKPLVVDVNVVISALMHKGDSLEVFLQNLNKEKFNLFAPYFLLIELSKYTEKIMKKTKLLQDEVLELASFITNQIVLVSENEFGDRIADAQEMLKDHYKDAPYLALALAYNCDLFSGDKVLKNFCPIIIKNLKEILQELNIN